jgi:protein gp37
MTDGHRTHTTAFRWTGEVRFVEEALTLPLRWRQPCRIFVNSMSDLFHEKVPDEWIDRIFAVMALAPHTFQVLTKRPERMRAYMLAPDRKRLIAETVMDLSELRARQAGTYKARIKHDDFRAAFKGPGPVPNVWLGVSVEDQGTARERWACLRDTPAALRWISYEPALAGVDFIGAGILPNALERFVDRGTGPYADWLVGGGESGPGARPFDLAWARSVVAQGQAAGVPVFVKQLGAHPHNEAPSGRMFCWAARGLWQKSGGCGAESWSRSLVLRDRKGGDWSEWPEDLRVREFPR